MSISDQPIIVEQVFPASVNEVWEALTKVEQMTEWFFNNIPAFDPVVGFQTTFPVQSAERTFTHLWKLLEVEPHNKIKYHWTYEEYPGEGFVTFELFEQGDHTLLRLTNEGLETFPQDIPEFARASCEGGWKYFIQGNLREFFSKAEK